MPGFPKNITILLNPITDGGFLGPGTHLNPSIPMKMNTKFLVLFKLNLSIENQLLYTNQFTVFTTPSQGEAAQF